MFRRPPLSHRPFGAMSLLLCGAAVLALPLPKAALAQQAAAEAEPAVGAGDLVVPPVPDGTPAEIMAFINGLMPPKGQPRSPEEAQRYLKDVASATVQAADKILAQVKPGDAEHVAAAKLKFQGFMMLGRMGDEQATKDMADFASTLTTSPDPDLAAEAKRLVIASEAQQMFSSGDLAAAPALVDRVVAIVAADPDDAHNVGLAVQFAGFLEHVPGGESFAVKAYEGLVPLLAKSTNPQIRGLAERFESTLRRLSLPGKPMEITGKLLDGNPFDQKSLAGKVVLVDFWAAWLGPVRNETPSLKTAYEKYHDKGFEVVGISLDEDRNALEKFIATEGIPWPILHDNAADGSNAMAHHYGISGVPQRILIGRDGNVIMLNVRAEKLAEELAKLFKDAG